MSQSEKIYNFGPTGARCPDRSKLSALGTQGTVINLVKVRALSAPFPKAARLARAFNKNMGPAETGSHLIRSDNGVWGVDGTHRAAVRIDDFRVRVGNW